jgi:hypothetical protein
MNPSSLRILVIAILVLEAGIDTVSCRTIIALRILVNISAIGSEVVITTYQLAFLTPGICPASDNFRKQILHIPNCRM